MESCRDHVVWRPLLKSARLTGFWWQVPSRWELRLFNFFHTILSTVFNECYIWPHARRLLDKIKISMIFLSSFLSSPFHGPSLLLRPWGCSFLLFLFRVIQCPTSHLQPSFPWLYILLRSYFWTLSSSPSWLFCFSPLFWLAISSLSIRRDLIN